MSKSQSVDFRAVKRKVTILQVLEHYDLVSKLHRNGDSLTGTCPIHGGDNKTAFHISISKNRWNCFQCSGNVLDFVAKMEKVSRPKAAHLLVQWFNLSRNLVADRGQSNDPITNSRLRKDITLQAFKEVIIASARRSRVLS